MTLASRTHGTGQWTPDQLGRLGTNVTVEPGVLIFHPEHVEIGDEVYIGHDTILKAYHRNRLTIGDRSWIGQQCFFHSAGGIAIGRRVGIGPAVKILTSMHCGRPVEADIMDTELEFAPVRVEDGADIGVGAVILPGVTIGARSQIGAGAVVAASIPAYAVAAGVPARVLRDRRETGR